MEIKNKIIHIFKRKFGVEEEEPKEKEGICPTCKIKAYPTSKKKEHFFCEKCNSVYDKEEVE